MINKITATLDKVHYSANSLFNNSNSDNNIHNSGYAGVPSGISMNYFVPFLGSEKHSKSPQMTKFENIMYYADTPTKKFITNLKNEAVKDGCDKITTLHVIKSSLNTLCGYLDKLDSGEEDFKNAKDYPDIVGIIISGAAPNIFEQPDLRKMFKDVLKNNISKQEN